MKVYKLLLLLVTIITTSCQHEHHQHPRKTNFLVTTPALSDTLIHKEYIGQIRAIQHIELRALEEGYLQKIYVDEGQKVSKGDLLFQISPLLYSAEVAHAKAQAEYSRIEYENTKQLADSNIVSSNELLLSKARYDEELADLALAQAHLTFTEIRAPFDGIVGRFNDIRLGSLVEEGELLSTLSDNSSMWVYFNVPEAEYIDYATNKQAGKAIDEVKLKMANGAFFEELGTVQTVAADFNNETGNIAFRATFPNQNSLLRHGQTGNVYLPQPLKNTLLIPQEATFEVLDKKYVFIVKKNLVEAKQIEIGHELPHLYEVIKGISPNDSLLVDGLRKVKAGDSISTEYVALSKLLTDLHKMHAE